jgi:predicted  nucleic acid-binding Zn-ribbon protein
MNGNEHLQKQLLDHEVRITRLEEALIFIKETLSRIEGDQKELRESLERQMEALRQEFHRDRRFSAMVFLTTQLAVVGALLRLAKVF